MGRGLLETLGLWATVVLAVPVAFVGVDFLLRGNLPVGLGFLAVAGLMVAVEEYVTTPSDIPAAVAETAAERIVADPEDDDEGAT